MAKYRVVKVSRENAHDRFVVQVRFMWIWFTCHECMFGDEAEEWAKEQSVKYGPTKKKVVWYDGYRV